MNNFYRAVQLALRHRLYVAGVLTTSLLVAVLWGANLGAAYPLIEVVFQGKSIPVWIDGEIERAEGSLGELEQKLAALDDEPAGQAESQREYLQSALAAKQKTLALLESLSPTLHRYMPAAPFQTLVLIVGAVMLATLIKCLFLVLNANFVDRLAHQTTYDLRNEFFRRTLRMDLATFGDDRTNSLMSRFTYDMECVTIGIYNIFGRAILEPLKLIACLAGAAFFCWRLLLVTVIVAPPAAIVIRLLSKSIKRANKRALQEMSQLYNLLGETFGGIHVVKAFNMEAYERNRFVASSGEFLRKAKRIVLYNSISRPANEFMAISIVLLTVLIGAYLVLNQQTHIFGIKISNEPMSMAELAAFYALLAGASDPMRKLSSVYSEIQRGAAAADRIFEAMDREPAVDDPANPVSLPAHHRRIVFDRISFHYTPDQPVLQEVSLEIPFGETLAIVGPNGCGKSTLANLVPRFYDPCEGAVRIDDISIRDVRLDDLRSRIGVVTQQTTLFDDTILNNIRYGSPEATDEQVMEAAKRAHAHRFIETRLEQGYQTIAGQGGNRLSGGQRQRISLARAILRDPEILILDEATSQVDLESEQAIHQVLEEFTRGRTTIIITHRLSTLTLADRILVMDGGQIADLGTHDELMDRCPLYQRLYEIQFKQSA